MAETTVAGWFEKWSTVPRWEKFDVLIKALGAEYDEDWRSLHSAALMADRQRKKENRRPKGQGGAAAPGFSSRPTATDGKPHAQPLENPASTMAQEAAPASGESPDLPSPAPTTGIPAARLVPRQLPVNVAHFTGRGAELAKLDALLTHDDAAQPAAMV
ncbi:MAG: hypothetical protein ACRDS9_20755, partial [Pseudonocardiaceae bacterium]